MNVMKYTGFIVSFDVSCKRKFPHTVKCIHKAYFNHGNFQNKEMQGQCSLSTMQPGN